jgi:hypothetical protein
MNTLAARPALDELYGFISKIDTYPVSVEQLVDRAKKVRASKPIVDFYKSFGGRQIFDDREDLLSRSEQVDIMRHEERDMPRDDLNVPEED